VKLYEHESKVIFKQYGIPIPKQYGTIQSVDEIEKLNLEFPVMIKAAVLTGGRGKAGGVKKAKNMEEARKKAAEILELSIKGYPVEKVFFEQGIEESGACYVGVTTDPKTFNNMVIISASGGVDIEEVAKTRPDAIIRHEIVNNDLELSDEVINKLMSKLKKDMELNDQQSKELASLLGAVYIAYQDIDAKLCEVNPVIITPNGAVAADAKVVLDDNGLYRQGYLLESLGITGKRHDIAEPTPNEKRAYRNEIPYVDLLNPEVTKDKEKLYVGLIPGGAGYGIFSIDEVANIGDEFFDGKVVPLNFMDSGGGPSRDKVAEMFHLLMDYPLTDIIITSRFGGISSCDVFIRGLIQALKERQANNKRVIPVYGRMVGTDLPAAKRYLDKSLREFPEALSQMEIVIGNDLIMADVIRKGIEKGFESKKEVSL